MKKAVLTFLIFIYVSRCFSQDVFDSIMSNIRMVQWENIEGSISLDFQNSELKSIQQLNKDVTKLLQRQSQNGSWEDIDYRLKTQTAWLPTQHLVRLHKLAIAYSFPNGTLNGNQQLFNAIENGLQYWYDVDPRSTNWWYQQIFCPKQIGEILILLKGCKQYINMDLQNKLFARMVDIGGQPDGKYSVGSANRVNISSHWIYRGCILHDFSVLEDGVKNALLPVKFNIPGSGVQPDYSFQEHGPQLYIGNYGYAFVDNIASISLYLRNTRYALSGKQLELFSHFVRNTYLNVIRGKYYSFSIPGRQVANKDNLDRSKTVAILDKMIQIDPQYKDTYIAAKQRWMGAANSSFKIIPSHTHYWYSDYTNHVRANYSFDVRFASDRTVRTENINNEDKKGFFLSDGATNMTVKGDEYFNIFGVWDWCKIPGVTSPHKDSLPDMKIGVGGSKSPETFCGGVSDSIYGASCYSLDYATFKIKGKKAWFFFDDEIVCLGTDITASSNDSIFTTVNQCRSEGDIFYSYKGTVKSNRQLFGDMFFSNQLDWVVHNGFGYYFPEKGNIGMSNKTQYGNWNKISVSQKDESVNGNVFALYFNHGVNPNNDKYAYVVVPNVYSAEEMGQYTKQQSVSIISNTSEMQSVYSKKLQLLEAVLYKENQELNFENSYSLYLNKPCVLMVRRINGRLVLHLSDPTQKLKNVTIRFEDKKSKKQQTLNISFPEKERPGSTITTSIGL